MKGNRKSVARASPRGRVWRKYEAELGVEYHLAIGQGKCRRGPWYAANMNGLRYGLDNAWLEAQGLVSFRQRWVALASIR